MLDQIFQIEISASAVAWYGAIVATGSFGIGFFTFLRDRSKVKLQVSLAFLTDTRTWMIGVRAINTGRRVVTLAGAGFETTNGKQIVSICNNPVSVTFPYELREGTSASVMFETEDLKQQLKEEHLVIKYAWYRDATGKLYKKRFRLR